MLYITFLKKLLLSLSLYQIITGELKSYKEGKGNYSNRSDYH